MKKKITCLLIALVFSIIGLFLFIKMQYSHNNGTQTTGKDNNQNLNVENKKITNFNLKFTENKNSKVSIKFFDKYMQHNMYYYNSNIELYLCENSECYLINDALNKNMVSLENILEKSISKNSAYDGGSSIYYFDNFNIVVCHKQRVDSNDKNITYNENIYIGNKKLKEVDICE